MDATSTKVTIERMRSEPEPDSTRGSRRTQRVLRVLLVEDNVDAAESMRLLLGARGADVEVAHDGQRALESFRRRPCDLVLMDLNLTDIDGFELVERMIADRPRPSPRFVSISGLSDAEDEARARAAGFDLHIVKPVDPARLYELCDQVLQRLA